MKNLKLMIPPFPWHGPRVREADGDRVVLLHGLWRSVWAMEGLAESMHQRGFETLNFPYPSFRKSLDELAEHLISKLEELKTPKDIRPTHFLTHSMGGILLRKAGLKRPDLITGKVVMVAPPNQGSEIIDWLEESLPGRLTFGPGGLALATNSVKSLPRGIPDDTPVGVIMGRRNRLPVFDSFLPGDNDGIVTVEGGKIPGVDQFKVIDADHTFIMAHEAVPEFAAEFFNGSSTAKNKTD